MKAIDFLNKLVSSLSWMEMAANFTSTKIDDEIVDFIQVLVDNDELIEIVAAYLRDGGYFTGSSMPAPVVELPAVLDPWKSMLKDWRLHFDD